MQVINPSVRFAPNPDRPDVKIDGVAVILKEFLAALEERGISHPPEKAIRQMLRTNRKCSTHHKQYFLRVRDGASLPPIAKAKVPRSNGHDITRCKSCICLSRSSVPEAFFEALSAKGRHKTLYL